MHLHCGGKLLRAEIVCAGVVLPVVILYRCKSIHIAAAFLQMGVKFEALRIIVLIAFVCALMQKIPVVTGMFWRHVEPDGCCWDRYRRIAKGNAQ